MTEKSGKLLKKNENGRYEVGDVELTSGAPVEILLGAHWVCGRVEYLHSWEKYALVVSSGEDFETVVVLHAGMPARLPQPARSRFP